MNYEDLISAYEVDVQFPDVSGMEHLDMLMRRSEIVKYEMHFSASQRQRVQQADYLLLQNAERFYAAIQSVADLASWRRDENVTTAHWWWYLDVLVQIPVKLENFELVA